MGLLDATSGGGSDELTASVAHVETRGGREVVVQDVIRAWAPPFEPNLALGEAAALLKSFGLRRVTGDRYAGGSDGGFVASALERHGVRYEVSERTKSEIYLEFAPIARGAGPRDVGDDHAVRSPVARAPARCGLPTRRSDAGETRQKCTWTAQR